ncbi:MAG: hypothetical protein K2K91_05795 [Ruminococcus sp.]|nr:hypothetical protein [Ruminococcus sp.]
MIIMSFYDYITSIEEDLGIDIALEKFIVKNIPSVRFDGFDDYNDDMDVYFFYSEQEEKDIAEIEKLILPKIQNKSVNFNIFIDETRIPRNFWDSFDFSNGDVRYAEMQSYDLLDVKYLYRETFDRDIFLTIYAECDHISKKFSIEIIFDNNYSMPVAVYSCRTVKNFRKLVKIALEQLHKEISEQRLSYYGDLWETIHIYLD